MTCERHDSGAIELYFYGELPATERRRVQAHLGSCPECRRALEDLETIRTALAARPDVSRPPAGDWSGFMTRLDAAVGAQSRAAQEGSSRRVRLMWSRQPLYYSAAAAALVAIVAMSILLGRRTEPPSGGSADARPELAASGFPAPTHRPDAALASLSDQHFERSKLVLLGLATRNPQAADAEDWSYERELASTLLDDTRLYRMAAEERGMTSLADVMRDLELVLLQTSMAEEANPETLAQLQRLIRRRDLLTKMNAVYHGS